MAQGQGGFEVPNSWGLAGKVAIVTGAGAAGDGIGNGRASAILLARAGTRVVVVDRDLALAKRTVELIEAGGCFWPPRMPSRRCAGWAAAPSSTCRRSRPPAARSHRLLRLEGRGHRADAGHAVDHGPENIRVNCVAPGPAAPARDAGGSGG